LEALKYQPTTFQLKIIESIPIIMKKGKKMPAHSIPRGSDRHNAKLEECLIPDIRQLLAEGKSWQWIADQYHVSKKIIQRIANGTGWTHVN